jgi:two-component system CheB/CheR fusion protein
MFSFLDRHHGMTTNKHNSHMGVAPIGSDFFERSWEQSWTYIKTVVDVLHEPVVVLDKDLRVLAANGPFYAMFQVEPADTEQKIVYELGNGQWNIPSLRKLLEDILPKQTFFKGFEVSHDFPAIGHKVMVLNGREIHVQKTITTSVIPAIILLAIEDVTEIMNVAKKLADHTNHFEEQLMQRTKALEVEISQLRQEMLILKK